MKTYDVFMKDDEGHSIRSGLCYGNNIGTALKRFLTGWKQSGKFDVSTTGNALIKMKKNTRITLDIYRVE